MSLGEEYEKLTHQKLAERLHDAEIDNVRDLMYLNFTRMTSLGQRLQMFYSENPQSLEEAAEHATQIEQFSDFAKRHFVISEILDEKVHQSGEYYGRLRQLLMEKTEDELQKRFDELTVKQRILQAIIGENFQSSADHPEHYVRWQAIENELTEIISVMQTKFGHDPR